MTHLQVLLMSINRLMSEAQDSGGALYVMHMKSAARTSHGKVPALIALILVRVSIAPSAINGGNDLVGITLVHA